MIPNIVHLKEEVINGLSWLLLHVVKHTQKLILMRQSRGGLPFLQKVPKRFNSGKSSKLETDGLSIIIADPSDNLVIVAILLKTLCVFIFKFVSGFGWFSDITSDIAPKFFALQKA